MEMEKVNCGKMENYIPQEARTFFEKINPSYLKIIVKNFDKVYPKIGKIKDKSKGFVEITDREQLKTLFTKRFKNIEHKFTYKRPRNNKDGRIFSNEWSLCGMNKIIRHTLAKEFNYDIDIVNAHPAFLLWYCDIHNIKCKYLKEYCSNRNDFLNNYADQMGTQPENVKITILSLINDQNRECEPQHPLYDFYEEMKKIQDKIWILNKNLATKCKNKSNPKGSCMSYFLQNIENKILSVMIDFCISKNIGLSAPCFDGFLVYKDDCDNYGLENLLSDLEKYVFETLDIPIKLSEKSMNKDIIEFLEDLDDDASNTNTSSTSIDIYDEIFFNSDIDITRENYYWIDFEKKYCYTIFDSYIELYREAVKDIPRVLAKLTMGKGFYIKKEHSDLLCSVVKLKDLDRIFFQYKGFKCDKEGKPEIQTISIDKLYINLKLPLYSHPDIILDKNLKSNAYNMFKGIQASKVDYIDYTLIDDFFKHLKDIICDGNQDEFHFFNSWIRWIIIHPHIKSKVFTFLYSGEGYGKTSIGDLLSKYIFGHSASYICAGLESVIGNFNRHLEGKIFCQIEELPSTSETFHSQFNKMKHYITDDKFSITPKGIDSYKVNNYLNFLGCSNNKYSLRMSAGDTRYFVLEIKKKMNSDYWKDYYNKFQNQKFGDILYSYYLQTNDSDYVDFHGRPEIPMNNLKRELIDFSMSSYDRFYKDIMEGEYLLSKNILMKPFVYKNIEYKYATTLNDLYNQFLDWAYINGVKDMNRKYLDFTKLHTGKFRFIDLQQRITNINELTFVVDYDKPPMRLLVEEGLDL